MAEEAVTPVSNEEFLNVASRASEEIKSLRAQIQFLAPKAQAYDSIVMILGLVPQRNQGMGEDLAFLLDRRVEALKRAALSGKAVASEKRAAPASQVEI